MSFIEHAYTSNLICYKIQRLNRYKYKDLLKAINCKKNKIKKIK